MVPRPASSGNLLEIYILEFHPDYDIRSSRGGTQQSALTSPHPETLLLTQVWEPLSKDPSEHMEPLPCPISPFPPHHSLLLSFLSSQMAPPMAPSLSSSSPSCCVNLSNPPPALAGFSSYFTCPPIPFCLDLHIRGEHVIGVT